MQIVQEMQNNQQDSNIQAEHHIHDSSSLIKVNADITENKKTMAIWCSFFIIVGFIYIMTFALPETFIEKVNTRLQTCPDSFRDTKQDDTLHYICKKFRKADNMNFGGYIEDMSRSKQFLIVKLVFLKNQSDIQKEFTYTTTFKGTFYDLDEDYSVDNKYVTKEDHYIQIKCFKGVLICQEVNLIYYSSLKHKNYAFVMNFKNDPQNWPLSDEIVYISEYVNPDYTGFLLALRYTCLIISIIMCISYIRKLQRISSSHWVIEQKYIVFLSTLLILFNNPFYALTILVPNMASAFFEVMFIVNFFVALLVFYLVVLERVVKENGQKESKAFEKKKVIFGIVIYFFLLLTYIGFSYNHLNDPYTTFEDSFGGFYEFCKWAAIIILIGYFMAIFYYYVRIFQGYNSLIWRNRLFSLFSLYYIMCTGIFVFSGSLDIYGSIGGRALLFITILNLYVYYLQYMYSFSPQGIKEAQQIINLEVGNRPQIYEVLDESLHGIELQSQNGDNYNNNNNNNNNNNYYLNNMDQLKPTVNYNNNNHHQIDEQTLAKDIFQQHQIYNQFNDEEKQSQTTNSGKKSTLSHNIDHHQFQTPGQEQQQQQQQQLQQNNNHPYQFDINDDNNNQQGQQEQQIHQHNDQAHNNHSQDQPNQNDGNLILNFEQQEDDDDDDL